MAVGFCSDLKATFCYGGAFLRDKMSRVRSECANQGGSSVGRDCFLRSLGWTDEAGKADVSGNNLLLTKEKSRLDDKQSRPLIATFFVSLSPSSTPTPSPGRPHATQLQVDAVRKDFAMTSVAEGVLAEERRCRSKHRRRAQGGGAGADPPSHRGLSMKVPDKSLLLESARDARGKKTRRQKPLTQGDQGLYVQARRPLVVRSCLHA